jgi:hypothetical protein
VAVVRACRPDYILRNDTFDFLIDSIMLYIVSRLCGILDISYSLFYYVFSLGHSCISFVDSTALEVCDNHRIHNHKVFEGIAERRKGSMGWF